MFLGMGLVTVKILQNHCCSLYFVVKTGLDTQYADMFFVNHKTSFNILQVG